MTTQTQYRPQLRLDEQPLVDAVLEELLHDVERAKAQLVDAKGYVEDYLDQAGIVGEYRCGPDRFTVKNKRGWTLSVPKAKSR